MAEIKLIWIVATENPYGGIQQGHLKYFLNSEDAHKYKHQLQSRTDLDVDLDVVIYAISPGAKPETKEYCSCLSCTVDIVG